MLLLPFLSPLVIWGFLMDLMDECGETVEEEYDIDAMTASSDPGSRSLPTAQRHPQEYHPPQRQLSVYGCVVLVVCVVGDACNSSDLHKVRAAGGGRRKMPGIWSPYGLSRRAS
jgi:hypothetical protein